MEVKIVISDASVGGGQGTTTIQINSAAMSPGARPTVEDAAAGETARGAVRSVTGSMPPGTDEMQDPNALPAGPARGAYGLAEAGETQAPVSLQPPAELLRAAAAMGAANAGPAPMLTGAAAGMTQGEPLQFAAIGVETAMMVAIGAPDQSAGAAPGSERIAPAETLHEEPPEGGAQ